MGEVRLAEATTRLVDQVVASTKQHVGAQTAKNRRTVTVDECAQLLRWRPRRGVPAAKR
jgi:hypothetical protein